MSKRTFCRREIKMKRVLFSWELGSGLGHMALLKPIAEELVKRGHCVHVSLKNFAGAHSMLNSLASCLLPSPVRQANIAGRIRSPATYAQLMHNVGFGDLQELNILVQAWRNLMALVRPDILVANYSPIAVLAARSLSMPYIILGTGFDCPPAIDSFPDWRPNQKNSPAMLQAFEQRVLSNTNQLLKKNGAKQLQKFSQLFSDAAETILVTYPELDVFKPRDKGKYYGIWPDSAGFNPEWPAGTGPKIFAYLRPIQGVQRLLKVLVERNHPTIIRMPSPDDSLRGAFNASNLKWETRFIDIDQTAHECDFAICHGSHMMTASILLSGKPQLLLPPYLEQLLNAENVIRLGAGVAAAPSDVSESQIHKMIEALSSKNVFVEAADIFRNNYKDIDRLERLDSAIGKIERVLNASSY